MGLFACDIVLLFDDQINLNLINLSKSIKGSNYYLSNKNRPHISLAKILLTEEEISQFNFNDLNINLDFNILIDKLKIGFEKDNQTSCILLQNTQDLNNLYLKILSKIKYYNKNDFENIIFSEKVNNLTKLWTINSIQNKNFNPHISLGFGEVKTNFNLKSFKPISLNLVLMCNYCTSKRILI